MNEVLTFFLTFVVLIGVIIIIYIILYNNLQAYKIKINEAESVIDDLLRKKYDSLITIKKIIIEKTGIDKKAFDDLNNLKDQNISSFDFERKLSVTNKLIEQMLLDHLKLEEDENFNHEYEEVFKLNERLEATKNFYNRYTSLLNKLIKKFPSNILAKIHHLEPLAYFDGKDLYDNNKEDFKL
ncbi:MAG: LemA family protein [Bacilli bacterium]|nr:LemA family protein [Bacilli bacterium]MDD4407116.1 LemA family protein [Bacilli bacterium]